MYYTVNLCIMLLLYFYYLKYTSPDVVKSIKIDMNHSYLYVYNKIVFFIDFSYDFVNFVCNNNPLLLDFYDDNCDDNYNNICNNADTTCSDKNNVEENNPSVNLTKYEDKYLNKFKLFPNEFRFTELELEQEKMEYEKIKINFEKQKNDNMNRITEELYKINEIYEQVGENNKFIANDDNKRALIDFNGLYVEYDDELDCVDYDELYEHIIERKTLLEKELQDVQQTVITDNEIRLKAHEVIIKTKLENYMNNYVVEHTPLGNVYMRYNNDKGSFEYFSNNTIPYRYLEPIGRRYVMTYWCKPIFVDIQEELKMAEIKFNEEKKKREDNEKQKQEELKNNSRNVMAKLKSYNTETKNQATLKPLTKNRATNNVLPPQIKANLVNVSQNSEKQLLKEHANRYTWEGRLTGFSPLKKIDKKLLDKNLTLSYADFKRMQKELQNKKYV